MKQIPFIWLLQLEWNSSFLFSSGNTVLQSKARERGMGLGVREMGCNQTSEANGLQWNEANDENQIAHSAGQHSAPWRWGQRLVKEEVGPWAGCTVLPDQDVSTMQHALNQHHHSSPDNRSPSHVPFSKCILLAGRINLYQQCVLFCNYCLGETLLVWLTILLHPSPTSCTGSGVLLSPGQTTSSDFFAVSCFVFKENFTWQLMCSLVFFVP